MTSYIEHANISVPDPDKTAQLLCRLFDWKVRWSGTSLQGHTSHVGTDDSYLALYHQDSIKPGKHIDTYSTAGAMNHLGIVVDDITLLEERVKAEGFETHSHGDYDPGKRFYFDLPDGIEIEVVSYK